MLPNCICKKLAKRTKHIVSKLGLAFSSNVKFDLNSFVFFYNVYPSTFFFFIFCGKADKCAFDICVRLTICNTSQIHTHTQTHVHASREMHPLQSSSLHLVATIRFIPFRFMPFRSSFSLNNSQY